MGFVADAVSDVGSKIGNQFGFGGGANQYRAPGDYSQGIGAAQQLALGGFNNQQQFIQGLQQQAAGGGPSVAQGLLAQQTQANNANAASQIGGIRGMNPALAARLMVNQNAQGNQLAAGQGATLRAGEMLNTQGLLGHALGQQRGQDISLLGTLGGMQQGINQVNAGVAGQNANISSNAIGGLMGGGGAAAAKAFAGGGEVSRNFALDDPESYIGIQTPLKPWQMGPSGGGGSGFNGYSGGPPEASQTADMTGGASYFDAGGPVPGRAAASGDSSRNDTVPAKLSPGEIVLPRSVAQAEDAPEKAAAFVRAIRRQKGPEGGYGAVLSKMRDIHSRLDQIEQFCKGGMVKGYADGGEVKKESQSVIASLAEALRHAVTRSGPGNSSPSVFDAKGAIDEHNKRLQEAAEAK